MIRISLVVLLAVLLMTSGPLCQPEEGKLIPVKPSFNDSPSGPPAPQDPYAQAAPTPREQMYVFWILGKVLSYPIDTAESYLSSWWQRRQAAPLVQPASAPPAPNPFDTIDSRQIPPAAPVAAGPKDAR
jgi:hypothetical protein